MMEVICRRCFSRCLFYVYRQRPSVVIYHKKLMSSDRIKPEQKVLQLYDELSDVTNAKDKNTFVQAIALYEKKNSVHKRGHVDFIVGSLEKMEEFEVNKDLQVYKALMQVFPKGDLVPKNLIQYEFMHYPKQQDTAISILSSMSRHGVIPDDQMGDIIISRFGKYSYVMKRYQRMMYWMPKFRNMNPYPVPWELPDKMEELAVMALKRMSVDYQKKVTLHRSSDVETDTATQDTFIASAISKTQHELIAAHDPSRHLFVEGGFRVYLRDVQLTYFILRADAVLSTPLELESSSAVKSEEEKSLELFTFLGEESEGKVPYKKRKSVHEQQDGTILGMCITGNSSKESLVTWTKLLQRDNPALCNIPIVFSLKSPETSVAEPEKSTTTSVTQ